MSQHNTPEEKCDWMRTVAINTMYGIIHGRVGKSGADGKLTSEDRNMIEFMADLYAKLSQGGQAADIEEALTAIATANIKQKYSGINNDSTEGIRIGQEPDSKSGAV